MKLTKQGIPDLNKNFPVTRPNPRVVKREVVVQEDAVEIADLLYADGNDIREEILGRYPDAVLVGEYDFVHEDRLSVTVRTTYLGWYKFLISSGLAGLSLCFQLAMHNDMERISTAMDEVRPGWRTRPASK